MPTSALNAEPAPSTCVLADLRITGRTRSASIVVDRDNTFFFDHPLDHLPAMLVVDSVRQLVEDIPDRGFPSRITGLDLSIHRFCEFTPDTNVQLERPKTAVGWDVSVTQGEDVVATGTVRLGRDDARVLRPPRTEPGAVGVEPSVVHRRHAGNVLIGRPVADAEGPVRSTVLLPPPDHHLRRIAPGRISATELIEAARQLAILIMHAEGAASDVFFLLTHVTLELDHIPARSEHLELTPGPTRRAGAGTRGSGLILADGTACGSVGFAGRTVGPRVYERMRAHAGVVAVHRDPSPTTAAGTAR